MRFRTVILLLLLAPIFFAQVPSVPGIQGSIEGVVARNDTGAPISGALVNLTLTAAPRGAGTSLQPVTTGADGKFFFTNLNKPPTIMRSTIRIS